MYIGKEGRLAIELLGSEAGEKKLIRVIHHPFDSSKRKILLEQDLGEIKHISFNEDRSLNFIGTVFGDLFVIDVDTGGIKRYSFGQQFRGAKISDSGNTFLLEHLEGGDAYYTTHRVRQLCVEPEVAPS